MALEPITRAEQIMSGKSLYPITREEMFLAKAAGMDVATPEPITRREMFLSKISGGSGGGGECADPVLQELSITENGEYLPSEGVDGFSKVVANIPTGGDTADTSFKDVIERTAVNPTLPSDLTKIGAYAFYNMHNLALTSLPNGVTTIGASAFQNCPNLALTSLPASVTWIQQYGFGYCTNLALTSLPAKLTKIDGQTFMNCSNLAIASIPAGVTNIGPQAFYSCTKLSEITFNGKPSTINSSAFKNCSNLLTINVPWAEGEVSNAPWGATNATINYNYTGV